MRLVAASAAIASELSGPIAAEAAPTSRTYAHSRQRSKSGASNAHRVSLSDVLLGVSAAGFLAGRSFLLLRGLLFSGLFLRRFLFRGFLCRGGFGICFLLLATPPPDGRRGKQFLAFLQRH